MELRRCKKHSQLRPLLLTFSSVGSGQGRLRGTISIQIAVS